MTAIVIDITDEDPGYPIGDASMPEPAVVVDDMEIILTLGPVELHMTYGQFDKMLERMNAWNTTTGCSSKCDLAE